MKRSLRVLLAAVAVLAALCSCAWAVVWDAEKGTYVVSQDVTIGERIVISGDWTIILEDGKTLNAEYGITVKSGDALTINGGPEGTGKLIATSNNNQNAAIGGAKSDAGKITINGGVVTAKFPDFGTAAAIGGGDDHSGGVITINGGVVTAINDFTANDNRGAAIGSGQSNIYPVSGGVIKITGGVVTARAYKGAAIGGGAPEDGAYANISGGTIIMTGGIVSAESENGDGIGYGVGCTGPDRGTLSSDQGGRAWIVASSIPAKSDDFKVGVIFVGDAGKVYGDVTISGDVEIPAGKTLTLPAGTKLTVPANASMKMADGGKLTVEQGATLTIEADAKFDATKGTVENKGTIVNEGALDASATGKIVNTGTIKNKGTMDAASNSIDNKGKIENDGTVNLPTGTSAEVIKALNMTGTGVVMAGSKEYSNDGTPTGGGGGDDDDPIIVNDEPVSADEVITIDELEIPGAEGIDTDNPSEPLTSADVIEDVAPILEGAVENMPESSTEGSKTISATAAVTALESLGISVTSADVDTVVVRMPIRKNTVSPGKTDTLIMFANLPPDAFVVPSDTPISVSDIKVIKVKSADSALPVTAAIEIDGSDFDNGCFMITDGDKKPVTQVDPNYTGTYNLIVRVTDLKDPTKIGDSDNFDVNTDPGTVVDPIIIVRDAKGTNGGSSGGACTAGAAAFVALAALAMIKRRSR